MPRFVLYSAAILAAASLAGCAQMAPAQMSATAHEAAVTDARRPEADRARDVLRKPAETVAFARVEPGDVVAELAPGGGYYTRVLAGAVGPTGKVYALVPERFASRPGGLDALNAIAAQYGNVEVVTVGDYAALELPEPVDVVWTSENYHDFASADVASVNSWAYRALKPGGIYYVEDHSAPGTGFAATSTLHRIDPEAVRNQVMSAGFVLAAQSDHLRNPDDPHDTNPRDVQPTSDKFAIRFRKPG